MEFLLVVLITGSVAMTTVVALSFRLVVI